MLTPLTWSGIVGVLSGIALSALPARAQDVTPASASSVVDDPPAARSEKSAKVPLIGPIAETWQFFSGKKDAVLADTWGLSVDPESSEPMLICRGEPFGYIKTRKVYHDFEMAFEWRYPLDANGNSGVLLFTSGSDRIWPTSMQIQLHQPETGSIFPSGGAKSGTELRNVPMVARPVNQWNQCHILSRDGTISVTINGQELGKASGCEPREGAIALQSEGAEIHFRRMWVREIESQPDSESPTEIAQPASPTPSSTEAEAPTADAGSTPASESPTVQQEPSSHSGSPG